jgi:hypothetical protein
MRAVRDLRVHGHDVLDRRAVHVDVRIERAAQVAIGEHAEHAAAVVDDRRHAESLAAHLEQTFASAACRA